MWFTITKIKDYNEKNLKNKWNSWVFFVRYLLNKIEEEAKKEKNKEIENIKGQIKQFKSEIIMEEPFIWSLDINILENDVNWEIYTEFVKWIEIFNWNEKVYYFWIRKINSKRIQAMISKIIVEIKQNNFLFDFFKKWFDRIKKFIISENVIEYANQTIIWSIDINWIEWYWKNNKWKYNKKRDLFLLTEIFVDTIKRKWEINDWLLAKKIRIFIKRRILNFINWEIKYYKDEQIEKIINKNLWLLIMLWLKIWLLQPWFKKINDVEWFLKKVLEFEYLSYWLICEECSWINQTFSAKNNILKFKCRWCWCKNYRKM